MFSVKELCFYAFLAALAVDPRVQAADCNQNGIEDVLDLRARSLGFGAEPRYGVGPQPAGIAAVDLDGDGMAELLTANPSARTVSVLQNMGDGTFGAAMNLAVGSSPIGLIGADLDSDGDMDIVTRDSPSAVTPTVTVLLNEKGVLKHEEESSLGFNSGWFTHSVSVADIDGDGSQDLLATPSTLHDGFAVLFNNGDGSFEDVVNYSLGVEPSSSAVSDFNSDGRPDVAVTNSGAYDSSCECFPNRSLLVLLGAGNRAFQPAREYRLGTIQFRDDRLFAVDLNGDRHPDLATNSSVLLNEGDGTFQPEVGYGPTKNGLTVADLNSDGSPDLVTGGPSVHINNGNGTFQPGRDYTGESGFLAALDMNNDGGLDLIAGDVSGTISIFLNTNRGDGTLSNPTFYTSPDGGPFTVAHLDRDAYLDLARIDVYSDSVSLFFNKGDGTFRAPTPYYPVEGLAQSLASGDFNRDGHLDMAAVSTTVSVLLNRGDGTFLPPISYGPDDGAGSVFGPIAVADFDGDGDLDIAAGIRFTFYYSVSLLINEGDGTFYHMPIPEHPLFPSALFFAVGDLDEDGSFDIATANLDSGRIFVLRNRGDGTFVGTFSDRFVGPLEGFLQAGDFDGDRHLDLVTISYPDIVVFHNDGTASFPRIARYPSSLFGYSSASAADMNADGYSDLAVATGCRGTWRPGLPPCVTSTLTLFWGTAGGLSRNTEGLSFAGYLPISLTTGDIDLDGDIDIAAVNKWFRDDIGGVSLFLNDGRGTFASALKRFTGAVPAAVMAADFSGDGAPELAVTSGLSGIAVLENRVTPQESSDLNGNGIPDECETRFHRGDANSNREIDISDPISIFGFLFLGDAAPSCAESADTNNDGTIDISDGIYLLSWLFTGGPEPAAPGPTSEPCGVDPDPAGSPGDLGCAEYRACP